MLGMVYSVRGKIDLPSKCTIAESKEIRAQAAREWKETLNKKKYRTNRSVGFGAPSKRKGPRRRPKASDNHIINN
jgi:hypothetical protein